MSGYYAQDEHDINCARAIGKASDMQAVILTGGLGTRLGSLVEDIPKPLLPVAGRPFLDHILGGLARHGVSDIVLLAGYKAGVVKSLYGPDSDAVKSLGLSIRVITEETPLGTGGAIRAAKDVLADKFFLLNGDSLFDFNYLDLTVNLPSEDNAPLATMALRHVSDARRYGLVEIDGAHHVTAFLEKPETLQSGLVNAGVYWMSREILPFIPEGKVSLEQDVFPKIASQGRLLAKVHDGYFIDIGIPDDLERADRNLTQALTRPAVFFDRDNTLIVDHGYTHKPRDLVWLDGVPQMIRKLNDMGIFVFVVTNQAGVAKGHYDEAAIERFHAHMTADLRQIGAHIDAFRYCPHHEDGTIPHYKKSCTWRKPNPGMLDDLLDHWPIDRSGSLMIGDQQSDVEAGKAAGLSARRVPEGGVAGLIDGWLWDADERKGT